MQLHSLRDSCGAWEGMAGRLWVCVNMLVRVRSRCDAKTMRDPQPDFNGLYRGGCFPCWQQRAVLAQRRRGAGKAGRFRSSVFFASSRLRVRFFPSWFCLTRSREGREELPAAVPHPLPRLGRSHTEPRKAREFFHAEPPRAPRVGTTFV